jgi:hypothetical protein
VLTITLVRRRHWLGLSHVAGVAPPCDLWRVPGAPDAVLGLAEWRGSVLTVLDLPRLVGEGVACPRPWLVRLAPPLDHVALACPALPVVGLPDDPDAAPLDPAALLARLAPVRATEG